MYSSGVGKTRIGFAEAGPPRPLPSASWDRGSRYVVSLAENPPIAPRAVSRSIAAVAPNCERNWESPPNLKELITNHNETALIFEISVKRASESDIRRTGYQPGCRGKDEN